VRLSEAEAVDSFYSEVRWEVEDTAQLKSSEDGVSCIGAITHGPPPFRFPTSPSPLALPSFPSFQEVRGIAIQISFPSPTVALAGSRSQASGLRPRLHVRAAFSAQFISSRASQVWFSLRGPG
jgi:hypothetical protein